MITHISSRQQSSRDANIGNKNSHDAKFNMPTSVLGTSSLKVQCDHYFLFHCLKTMSFSISVGMRRAGRFRRLGLSLRRFSDLHHLPPSTETTPGYCLVRAVRDSGLSTVKAALESGVDPNFRSEEVRPEITNPVNYPSSGFTYIF